MDQEAATLALQLANQLPEDFVQAGMVLGYLDQLRHWRAGRSFPQLSGRNDVKDGDHEVIELRREGVGGSSTKAASLSSNFTDRPSVLPK